METYTHLSLEEREQIFLYLNQGKRFVKLVGYYSVTIKPLPEKLLGIKEEVKFNHTDLLLPKPLVRNEEQKAKWELGN